MDAIEHTFDDGWVRRADLGYKRLYVACWDARIHDDLPELLRLAAHPSLSPDMLATIAPDTRDHAAPAELVNLVLDHPACPAGVASRFATHPDSAVRLRVANFPGLVTSQLAILAIDANDQVRAAAIRVLDERAGSTTGDC